MNPDTTDRELLAMLQIAFESADVPSADEHDAALLRRIFEE
jgi:hypothetical protein